MKTLKHHHLSQRYGFIALLISLLLMLVLFPFLNNNSVAQLLFNLTFSLILLASLYSVSTTKRQFYLGLFLILPSLATKWVPYASISGYIFTSLFLGFIIFSLCRLIFTAKKINMNLVYGATCIYILLGIAWAILFALIDYFVPTAFSGIDGSVFSQGHLDLLTFRFENLLYFSYVTLTTLGYGDIIPLAPGVKFLSIIEAITGQLYIGTVIARILGLYLTQTKKS